MKIYCIETDCPKKPANYALCTGLMNINDCPKVKARKAKEEAAAHEKDRKSYSNVPVQS